jgi:hypothetical protein
MEVFAVKRIVDYEKEVNAVIREVEKILKENMYSQGIHISIDMDLDNVPLINFEVSNRFAKISEG